MGVGRGEIIALLVRRHEVLRAVATTPRSKAELASALDLSRSTIDRSIRELVTYRLVEEADDGFITTTPGDLALAEYDRFSERLEGFGRIAEALSVLPADAPIDRSLLGNTEVTLADPDRPDRPTDAYAAVIEEATAIREIAPVIDPRLVETYRRRIVEEGLTVRLVATGDVTQRLVSAYTESLQATLETGRLSIREVESFPYRLTIAESATGLSVNVVTYTERGVHGFLKCIDPDAIQWAELLYRQQWRTATPLSEPGT